MGASVGREEDSSLYVVFVCVSSNRLRKAAEDAANLTPEAVAANMSPEEKDRLSRVRNIGIAVCFFTIMMMMMMMIIPSSSACDSMLKMIFFS